MAGATNRARDCDANLIRDVRRSRDSIVAPVDIVCSIFAEFLSSHRIVEFAFPPYLGGAKHYGGRRHLFQFLKNLAVLDVRPVARLEFTGRGEAR
jgi:hypothetical protein